MNCPYCKNSNIVKNGHSPSSKQRWKCNKCNKSFDNNTIRKFPPTTIPFQFIALILYISETWSYNKTYNYINDLLKILKIWNITIYPKGKIAYSTIHKWKKQYKRTYKDLISFEEAKNFYFKLIRNGKKPILNSKPIEEPIYKIKTITIPKSHMEALKNFRDMTDFMGKNSLDYMKTYKEIIKPLLKEFKKEKQTTIVLSTQKE